MGLIDKIREIAKHAQTPQKEQEAFASAQVSPQTDGIDGPPPEEQPAPDEPAQEESAATKSLKSIKEKLKQPGQGVEIERESSGLQGGFNTDSSLHKADNVAKVRNADVTSGEPTSLINTGAGAHALKQQSQLQGGFENKAGSADINSGKVHGIVKDFNIAGGLGSELAEDITKVEHKKGETVEVPKKPIKLATNAGAVSPKAGTRDLTKTPGGPVPGNHPSKPSSTSHHPAQPPVTRQPPATHQPTDPATQPPVTTSNPPATNNATQPPPTAATTNNPPTQPAPPTTNNATQPPPPAATTDKRMPREYSERNQSNTNLSQSSLMGAAGVAALGAGAAGMGAHEAAAGAPPKGTMVPPPPPAKDTTAPPREPANDHQAEQQPNIKVRNEREVNTTMNPRADGNTEHTQEITDRRITEETTDISPEEAKRLGLDTSKTAAPANAGNKKAGAGVLGGGLAAAGIGAASAGAASHGRTGGTKPAQPQPGQSEPGRARNQGADGGANRHFEDKPEVEETSYLGQDRAMNQVAYECTAYKRRYFLQFLWTKRHFTLSPDGVMKYYRNVNRKRRGEFNISEVFSSFNARTVQGKYGDRLVLVSDKVDELAFESPEQRDEFLYWFKKVQE